MDFAVDFAARHQLVVGTGVRDLSVLQHDDQVGVLHGSHALGDNQLGRFGDEGAETRADLRVRPGVHRAGAVVENQDLRLFQQRPGDAQPLLLAAGYVRSALFDPGVVFVGEILDKGIRLRQPAGLLDFLVRGVFIAPAQVVPDRAAEQFVLLQHHGHPVAQGCQVVFFCVHAADPHGALRGVVQPRNQLHQRALAAAGAAQDADDGAGGNMQVDITQRFALAVLRVAEGYMVEVDGSVLHAGNRVRGGSDVRFLVEHFHNPLRGSPAHCDHQEGEGEHHQAGQNLDHIGDQAHQLSGGQARGRIVAGGDDRLGTQPGNHQRAGVDAGHHQRRHESNVPLRLDEILIDGTGDARELFRFVILAHKTFHDPDPAYILLHDVVQLVIGLEYAAENRMRPAHDQVDSHGQHRQRKHEHQRNPRVDRHRHDQREQQHQRSAYRHPQDHLKAVLHVGDVRGQARDNRGRAEFIDIGKGKLLNPVVHVMPQVPRESGGGNCRHPAAHHAGKQRNHRCRQQNPPVEKNLPETAGTVVRPDSPVNQHGHDHRDQRFHRDLSHHEQRRRDSLLFILPDPGHQFLDHTVPVLTFCAVQIVRN